MAERVQLLLKVGALRAQRVVLRLQLRILALQLSHAMAQRADLEKVPDEAKQ
jgi:hypothetical protein